MPGQLADHTIIHVLATVHHGGAERVVLALAQCQRARGADARVVCLQQLGDLLPAFEAAGVPVRLLDAAAAVGALRTAWRLARLASAIATQPWCTRTTRRRRSPPAWASDCGTGGGPAPHWCTPSMVASATFGRRFCSCGAGRRASSMSSSPFLPMRGEQLLQHGIQDAARRRRRPQRRRPVAFRQQRLRTVPGNGARIVHVGRLDPIKGQDLLLAAMPIVREHVPGVTLTIVGDGPTRRPSGRPGAFERGLADIVTFAGATDDVRPFLRRGRISSCSRRAARGSPWRCSKRWQVAFPSSPPTSGATAR